MAIVDAEKLDLIRKKHSCDKIVFCSGGFDLTHAGHTLFFEECKKLGDVLVVMIGCDDMVRRDKGKHRPILNQYLRLKMVDSLKYVDYCFIDKMVPADKPPLWYFEVVLEKLRPDIYVVNKDASDIPYRKKVAHSFNTKLLILERTCPEEFEKISATSIIKKIKDLA